MYRIDIVIDDSAHICMNCIEKGSNTLIMDTPYNKQENIPRVYNDYISNYKKEKLNVILNTNTYNECDDQFALSYMIKS